MERDHPWIGVDNIILDDDGRILLVRRPRNAKVFPGMWGLISGMIESSETVEEALKREAKEEIGVNVEIVKYTGRYYDAKNRHPTKTVICLPHLTKIVSGNPIPKEQGTEVKWFSKEEIRKMNLAYDHKKMLIDEDLI